MAVKFLGVPPSRVHPFGSAGLPGISFAGDDDTGLFRQASDVIGVSLGGTERLRYSAAAFAFQEATTISAAGNTITFGENIVFGAFFGEYGEIADPAAPATNNARLYAKDNGAGKTQLAVRFPTGAVQILATEP